MAADKRTVSTDALETLGTIIDESAGRDAIHLAVEPAVAAHKLKPGEDVGRMDDGTYGDSESPVGIVDPFLKSSVKKGQRFWLVVYPRQITSLRHVWTHPAFDSEQPKAGDVVMVARSRESSEAWLRRFCDEASCPGYEQVIAKAVENDSWSSEYLHFQGQDAHGEIPPEFYDHLEVVTGIKVPESERATYFSCSC